MRRLSILIKGNADLHDALFALHLHERCEWNGINECLLPPGHRARVTHETFARSDILLQVPADVPGSLAKELPFLEPYSAASQFRSAIYSGAFDAIVLSVQPDVTNCVWEHKTEGYRFYVPSRSWSAWPEVNRQWMRADFRPRALLETHESMSAFATIVSRIRQTSQCPIVVANLSPWIEHENLHTYHGTSDCLTERIRRFNLGLIELSRSHDVSILDVERIVTGVGAHSLKRDLFALDATGCRLVAEEAVRIFESRGLLEQG